MRLLIKLVIISPNTAILLLLLYSNSGQVAPAIYAVNVSCLWAFIKFLDNVGKP